MTKPMIIHIHSDVLPGLRALAARSVNIFNTEDSVYIARLSPCRNIVSQSPQTQFEQKYSRAIYRHWIEVINRGKCVLRNTGLPVIKSLSVLKLPVGNVPQ